MNDIEIMRLCLNILDLGYTTDTYSSKIYLFLGKQQRFVKRRRQII